ncbi:MAG: hypothetical protein IAI48_04210 [Candidatus Eremiobacteraeota bacterium]|nr:hypothetical protein [Candidatus Eremiobacteraeota bacterium]
MSLTDVAHTLGYHYAYLGPDEAVALSRPGIVVIVRPGAPLFDMNDREIPVTGAVPVYKDGEVYVSSGMVATLRRLAGPNATVGRDAILGVQPSVSGPHRTPAILSLSAMHIEGDQALHVEGQATPFAAITLTLTAKVSRSIPDVVVSRLHVEADKAGAFTGRVAIAPVYFTGSLYTVVAATDANMSRSVTTVVSEFPNGHSKVPSEETKRGNH